MAFVTIVVVVVISIIKVVIESVIVVIIVTVVVMFIKPIVIVIVISIIKMIIVWSAINRNCSRLITGAILHDCSNPNYGFARIRQEYLGIFH